MPVITRTWNDTGYLQLSLSMLLLVAVFATLKCPAIWAKETLETGVRNVTCISHDSQFTCDCGMMDQEYVLPPLIGSAYELKIQNCKSLTINSNALEDVDVHKISFTNVDDLILREKALAFPQDHSSSTPWIISFEKVKIKLIDSHAIKGQIKEITIINSHIEMIKPFGFNILNNNAYLFKMDKVQIHKIEAQAFKKLVVENIDLQNCIFLTNVPSKTFYDVEVTDTFNMNNNRFKEVHTRAFSFKMISKLIITNNYFDGADAEWIEAYVMKSPQIKDNYFGTTSPIAFKAIKIHRDYRSSEKLELRFSNNTVHFARNVLPLEFSSEFITNIKQLNYDNPYPCQDIDNNFKPPRAKEHFFDHFKHFIYFRQDAVANEKGGGGGTVAMAANKEDYKALNKIIEIDCQRQSYWMYIVIGVVCLLVIITIIVVIICWRTAKKRREKRKMDIIQPEPRTYKETQIVYQIENAGLLKTDF